MAIDISSFLDLNELQRIQDLFSDATGLAAVSVNLEGTSLTKPSNFTDFCMKYTRGNKEGLRRCVQSDIEGKGTYFCHAGLMDFCCQIIVDGEHVGNVLGGQVLPKEPVLDEFRIIARDLGVDENVYLAALAKVPIIPEKKIRAAARMLEQMVNQWVNANYFQKLNEKKVGVFSVESARANSAIKKIQAYTKDLQSTASMENILAINASIEASHVGQAGAGFAVVAEEIGKLSKNSAKVYSAVQSLILEISDSVDKITNTKI